MSNSLEEYFAYQHNNPPKPFNAKANPKSWQWSKTVSQSMVSDNFYSTHTREECKIEWNQRYTRQALNSSIEG